MWVGKGFQKTSLHLFSGLSEVDHCTAKIRAMIDLIENFETIDVNSEAEALLLEGQLIKKYRPRYNTDFTDDKRFLLVRVDLREPLPRFRLTRNRVDSRSRHYGPFAHSGDLRKTLAELRRKYGILLGDAKPVSLGGERWRLYDDARQELYEHPNEITQAEYLERVDAACECLEGKAVEWLAELKQQMQQAAEKRDYEKAASYATGSMLCSEQLSVRESLNATYWEPTTTAKPSSTYRLNSVAGQTNPHGVL